MFPNFRLTIFFNCDTVDGILINLATQLRKYLIQVKKLKIEDLQSGLSAKLGKLWVFLLAFQNKKVFPKLESFFPS